MIFCKIKFKCIISPWKYFFSQNMTNFWQILLFFFNFPNFFKINSEYYCFKIPIHFFIHFIIIEIVKKHIYLSATNFLKVFLKTSYDGFYGMFTIKCFSFLFQFSRSQKPLGISQFWHAESILFVSFLIKYTSWMLLLKFFCCFKNSF